MRRVLILLAVISFILPLAQAEVIVCEKGCDFSSIQPAIDSAQEEDTIVAEGIFFENLKITKNLILAGNITLYPTSVNAGVSISADGVEIRGLSIKGGITGIEVVNSKGVKIVNCNLSQNFYGVLLYQSSDCEVKENNFYKINESAIRIEGSSSNTISSNQFSECTVATHFLRSSENNLTDSSFFNVRAGVYLEESLGNNIVGNKISAEDTGIFMYKSSGNRISENIADGDVFVHLLLSSKNTIENNEAEGIYANFNSQKNDFDMGNLKLTGEEFQFSIVESAMPNEFTPLSNFLNITVVSDIYTEEGYVSFESEIPADDLDLSTVGIYYLGEDGWNKLSDSTFDGEIIRTNFTTTQNGIYVFAGKKLEKLHGTSAEQPNWILGFESIIAAIGILLAIILRGRISGK